MLYPVVAAGFEDIEKAQHVGVDVGVGVFEAVTHAGLCGEMTHPIEFFIVKKPIDALFVEEIHFYEPIALELFTLNRAMGGFIRLNTQLGEAVYFELWVVVVVDVVDSDDFDTLLRQFYGEMVSYKPCGTGDEDFHMLVN